MQLLSEASTKKDFPLFEVLFPTESRLEVVEMGRDGACDFRYDGRR
jgi:hypothetical protein